MTFRGFLHMLALKVEIVQELKADNKPHRRELVRDIPEENIRRSFMTNKIIVSLYLPEARITYNLFRDMLEQIVYPQAVDLELPPPGLGPTHGSSQVREALSDTFPDRWIGRDRPISWPPSSPYFALQVCFL
jgi:hypothetical protein